MTDSKLMVRKQASLTLSISEANKLETYLNDNNYISFSGLCKKLIFDFIDKSSQQEPEHPYNDKDLI